MNDAQQALIETIATKLGTTAEHLWGVLIKQAPISAATDLASCVVFVLLSVGFILFVKRNTTVPDGEHRAIWNNEGAFFAWFAALLFLVFTIVTVTSLAGVIIAGFINPEYWALQRILK